MITVMEYYPISELSCAKSSTEASLTGQVQGNEKEYDNYLRCFFLVQQLRPVFSFVWLISATNVALWFRRYQSARLGHQPITVRYRFGDFSMSSIAFGRSIRTQNIEDRCCEPLALH